MSQLSISPALQLSLNTIIRLVNSDRYAALNQCELGFTQARAAKDHAAFIAIAIQYGLVIDQLGYPEESINILNEAVQLAQSQQCLRDEARLLNVIGRAVYTRAEYRRAMQAWARCLEVATRANDPISWIWAKLGIAQIYDALQDHATAVNLLQQAKARAQSLDAPILKFNILLNLGVNLFYTQSYAAALVVYEEGLVIIRQLDHLDDLGEILFRIAEVALIDGRIDDALSTLDEAQGICMEANHIWGLAHIHGIRAQALAQQSRIDEALEEIKIGIDYATAAGAMHIEMRLLEIQVVLAERQYAARKLHLNQLLKDIQAGFNDVRELGQHNAVQWLELQSELTEVHHDIALILSAMRTAKRVWQKMNPNHQQQQLAELDTVADLFSHE